MAYTVYPKKYAHGFCFAVLCCGYTLTDFPISIRLTSLALWQSNDYPSASKATLMNMDKYFMWIHYERLHNHNKAKHNKTVCIFLGIYCSMKPKHISARKVLGGINSWFFHCQVLIKRQWFCLDNSDVIISTMASQINSLTIVYSTVFSGADQIKHQLSTSLAFVRGIQRWPVNSRHKWPVTRKCFHLTTSSCHDAITQAEIQYSFTKSIPQREDMFNIIFLIKGIHKFVIHEKWSWIYCCNLGNLFPYHLS